MTNSHIYFFLRKYINFILSFRKVRYNLNQPVISRQKQFRIIFSQEIIMWKIHLVNRWKENSCGKAECAELTIKITPISVMIIFFLSSIFYLNSPSFPSHMFSSIFSKQKMKIVYCRSSRSYICIIMSNDITIYVSWINCISLRYYVLPLFFLCSLCFRKDFCCTVITRVSYTLIRLLFMINYRISIYYVYAYFDIS